MTRFEADALAELQALRRAMERIADALDLTVRGPVPAPVEEPCSHPVDQRADFGVTHGRQDWECQVCGYRSLAEEVRA